MSKKQKIEINKATGGLHNPFAALQLDNLPAASEKPASPEPRPAAPQAPAKLGRVVLRREKAHRGGKTVIVLHDFASNLSTAYIEELGRRLRKACGCGGTTHEREVEIQGDQPEKVRAWLEAEGFRVAGVR